MISEILQCPLRYYYTPGIAEEKQQPEKRQYQFVIDDAQSRLVVYQQDEIDKRRVDKRGTECGLKFLKTRLAKRLIIVAGKPEHCHHGKWHRQLLGYKFAGKEETLKTTPRRIITQDGKTADIKQQECDVAGKPIRCGIPHLLHPYRYC